MRVRFPINGLLLAAIPATMMVMAAPELAQAQGMSEWGVWDSPRRSTIAPRSVEYLGQDDRDYDNGADPGDDGRDDDAQDFRGDRGDSDLDDPTNDDRRYGEPTGPDRFDSDGDTDSGSAQNATPGAPGGARPFIAAVAPPEVPFSGPYEPGSIVIDTSARKLYYVTSPSRAFAYAIGVGREGFAWSGSEKVSRIQDWPDWYPPADMRRRKPDLPARMLGGIRNPLGAKAIYLGNTLYRIHGTNDPKSIGKAQSSGCFRMLNENVLHLATLVHVGTPVTVVRSLGGGIASAERPKSKSAAKARRRDDRDRADRYFDDDEWAYRNEARNRYRGRDPYYDRPRPYWDDPYVYQR